MSDQKSKATAFRALHARAGAFIIPNPWDAGTAKILTHLGFEALATTSAGLAFSLGRSDGAVSGEETLANAQAIVQATHLPVSADLEDGFGHAPEKAAETIRLAIGVGLVGGSIEDASGDSAKPIYDFNLAVERIAAAMEAVAAQDIPFILTARAENFLHERPDLDDTIKRLQAFEKAGADVLYAPGLPSLEAIREVCSALTRPVNVVAGLGGPAFSLQQLSDAGVKRVSVGSALSRAALGAFTRAATDMKETGSFEFARQAIPYAEINGLMKFGNTLPS
jgi:2-methylisocitrate lyase-like PEP mutase family enzyme